MTYYLTVIMWGQWRCRGRTAEGVNNVNLWGGEERRGEERREGGINSSVKYFDISDEQHGEGTGESGSCLFSQDISSSCVASTESISDCG